MLTSLNLTCASCGAMVYVVAARGMSPDHVLTNNTYGLLCMVCMYVHYVPYM